MITSDLRRAVCVVAALILVVWGTHAARAQTTFLRGQSIQPVYEGWEKNADGTVSMYFGYMNRNYEDAPEIPIGPNNFFQPGPQDQGQPTHFDTRRQMFVFKVTLPADWGNKELVWSVTYNGRTNTAIGSTMPHWIVDEGVWRANRGAGITGRTASDYTVNRPPSVSIVGATTVKARVGETVSLVATATDDGRPGPRPKQRGSGGGEGGTSHGVVLSNPDLPTLGGSRSNAATGTGGPTDQNIVQPSTAYTTGLAITWRHYRGPGKVLLSPRAMAVKSGDKASTSVRFTEPGTYVIRAVADDSSFTAGADVTVIVAPSPSMH